MPEVRLPKRLRRMSMASAADYPATRGEGHREADPPALADLVPDGPGQAGFGARDQARGGGVQRHERRRVRAALLRGPGRAREPRDPARGREAGRGLLRGRALLAAAGELLPRRDQIHRRGAGGAEHGAAAADRRRLRLRRAAAAGPAAGRLGPPEPAQRGRARPGRDGDDRLRRRPRPLPAPLQDRDRDLAPQDDRVHLLHDGAGRDREAQGRPLPPGLPRRPVLFDRPRARARGGARLPPLADPGQGRLRLQGRARLLAARGLRPPRLRQPRRLAAGRDPGHGEDLHPRADRLADRARLRRLRRAAAGEEVRRRARQGPDLRDRLRLATAS